MCHRLWKRRSAAADVQTLVEFLVLLLLLGIEPRQQLLFGFCRRRIRRKLLGARLQMTNRRVTVHREAGASDRSIIAEGVARNEGAAKDCYGEKRCAHGSTPLKLSAWTPHRQ